MPSTGKFFTGKIRVHTEGGRYCIKVITVLKNRGEAGWISIFSTAKNMDRDRTYTRSRRVWIGEAQVKKVQIVFNEAGFFSPRDTWKCWSEVRPAEKIGEPQDYCLQDKGQLNTLLEFPPKHC